MTFLSICDNFQRKHDNDNNNANIKISAIKSLVKKAYLNQVCVHFPKLWLHPKYPPFVRGITYWSILFCKFGINLNQWFWREGFCNYQYYFFHFCNYLPLFINDSFENAVPRSLLPMKDQQNGSKGLWNIRLKFHKAHYPSAHASCNITRNARQWKGLH